jgi:hypothetical protein
MKQQHGKTLAALVSVDPAESAQFRCVTPDIAARGAMEASPCSSE